MSDKDYRIRFAGEEIPAYQAWEKLETANAALELLTRFNANRPRMSSEVTRGNEEEVRRRLAKIEVLLPTAPPKDPDMADKAAALLQMHTPEEVLDVLKSEHNLECDLNGLIHLAGTEAYYQSLKNEGALLSQNKISYEQMADLWNDAKRPAPGKPFWDAIVIKALFERD